MSRAFGGYRGQVSLAQDPRHVQDLDWFVFYEYALFRHRGNIVQFHNKGEADSAWTSSGISPLLEGSYVTIFGRVNVSDTDTVYPFNLSLKIIYYSHTQVEVDSGQVIQIPITTKDAEVDFSYTFRTTAFQVFLKPDANISAVYSIVFCIHV